MQRTSSINCSSTRKLEEDRTAIIPVSEVKIILIMTITVDMVAVEARAAAAVAAVEDLASLR